MRADRGQGTGNGEQGAELPKKWDVSVPAYTLPVVTGVPLSGEILSQVALEFLQDVVAELACARLLSFSYLPGQNLLCATTSLGFAVDNLAELRLPLAEFSSAEKALRTGEIQCLTASSVLPDSLASYFSTEKVVLPLCLGDRPMAVFLCQPRPGVSPRSTEWQAKAKVLAEKAALFVELRRLATAYQDELRLRTATRDLTLAILEGRPLAEITESITAIVARILRVERAALCLRDSAGNLHPIHLRNMQPEWIGVNMARLLRGLQASGSRQGQPHFIPDLASEPTIDAEKRALFAREGITSVLTTLLRYAEGVDGALLVFPEPNRTFTPSELTIFQNFADMTTLGVAMSHHLEQQRGVAQAEERNRLAREMHDTVAQALVGLSIQMETAQTYLDSANLTGLRELLHSSRTLAKRALDDTRRAVQGLSPASLEKLSAPQAIAEEARQFETESGTPTPFLLSGEELPLTPDQCTALLRITQEALTNARKHAQAQRVRVGLKFGGESVTLLIEDDGVGFEATLQEEPGPDSGYGLFSMIERARLVGGELTVDSTPGWGTRIQALLPYRPASEVPPVPALPAQKQATTSAPIPTATSAGAEASSVLRVLIADDNAIVRQGIRAMLEATGQAEIVGEANDGGEALAQARILLPDVILMDIQMPRVDGLEGLRQIRTELPQMPVVILTSFQTDEAVREAFRAGARGFLLKDTEAANLLAGIRAAVRGESLVSPAITERLATLAEGQAADGLNDRALEVLQLLAQGSRNKEIAARLFISERTVEYHLSNIFLKLGVTNRTEAARIALERGLVKANNRD